MIDNMMVSGKVPERICIVKQSYVFSELSSFRLVDYSEKYSKEYIENIPMSNFIIKPLRCDIIDIRGLQIRLFEPNMSFLLSNAKMYHGRIAEPCKYVRRRGGYWLSPVRFLND